MAGCVNDVDLGIFVHDGGIFGENGYSSFPLDIVGVHDTFCHLLAFPEHAALLQQFVHQSGFAVVNMCNDCYISYIFSTLNHRFLLSFCWEQTTSVRLSYHACRNFSFSKPKHYSTEGLSVQAFALIFLQKKKRIYYYSLILYLIDDIKRNMTMKMSIIQGLFGVYI